MDVYELVDALGGDIVSNQAVVRIDDEPVVVGEIIDNAFQLNEAGKAIAAKQKPASAPATKPKKKATTRKRARTADGRLKADDPSTPDVNEAWEDGDS